MDLFRWMWFRCWFGAVARFCHHHRRRLFLIFSLTLFRIPLCRMNISLSCGNIKSAYNLQKIEKGFSSNSRISFGSILCKALHAICLRTQWCDCVFWVYAICVLRARFCCCCICCCFFCDRPCEHAIMIKFIRCLRWSVCVCFCHFWKLCHLLSLISSHNFALHSIEYCVQPKFSFGSNFI